MSEWLEAGKTYWIPLERIEPGKWSLREEIGGEKLEELKKSMTECGLLAPIIVEQTRPLPDDFYEVWVGNRRFQAARELQWEKIWCSIVRTGADYETVAGALIENIQREDLTPMEESRAVKKMMDLRLASESDRSGENARTLTQAEIARVLGKSQQFVSQCLQIAQLTDDQLETLPEGRKTGKKKLLQLVKSNHLIGKKLSRRPPDHFTYNFKRNQLSIRGKVDLESDDLDTVIKKLEELIEKLREKQNAAAGS